VAVKNRVGLQMEIKHDSNRVPGSVMKNNSVTLAPPVSRKNAVESSFGM